MARRSWCRRARGVSRPPSAPAAVGVTRHSAEHVMADAVKRLFPECQIDVGRADHSEKFQYDFLVPRPFTPEDLEQIEKEMGKIVAERAAFTRETVSRAQARERFAPLRGPPPPPPPRGHPPGGGEKHVPAP